VSTALGGSVLIACLGVGLDCNAAELGFYAGADGALVAPTVDKSEGVNFGTASGVVHVDPESVRFDESGFGWSGFVGYRINSHLAAELAYLDFGSIGVEESFDLTDVQPGGADPSLRIFDFNLRVSGPMVSVMGILPFSDRIEAFGRAGVLWASQEVQLGQGFSFDDAEDLWGLGLGLQAELGRGWSARLEYQRFDDMRGTVVSGESRLERLLLGATYDIGSRANQGPASGARADADETGFYAVADLGVTEPAVGKSAGFLISFSHIPGVIFFVRPSSSTSDGSDAGGGVALGYRINRYLAAEFAYTDFGEVDIREHYVVGPIGFPFPIPALEFDVDVASRVAGPSLSVLGILPVSDEFEIFARGGVLFADQDVSRAPGAAATNSEELLIWGAGVDVEITRRWSVRFAYENLEDLRRTQHTGPIRIERFVVGASYEF
jgi:opacity protein-like surface antigen